MRRGAAPAYGAAGPDRHHTARQEGCPGNPRVAAGCCGTSRILRDETFRSMHRVRETPGLSLGSSRNAPVTGIMAARDITWPLSHPGLQSSGPPAAVRVRTRRRHAFVATIARGPETT